MTQQEVVSLGIIGKESQFPFTGIFAATQRTPVGNVSAVGRIHDADIKRSFCQTIELSKELNRLIANHAGRLKPLLRKIWDWYHHRKPHSQIICLVVQVVTDGGEMWLSMIGAAGVWGIHDGIWYPLLAEGSSVLSDKEIEGYPMAMQVDPFPKQVLVIPKPFKNVLPSAAGLSKRLYEVNYAE